MNITEVRVKLMRNRSDRLRAFCSITIDDDFVVHDLRVIEGRKGFFVAMPSRKLADNCPRCGSKNELRSKSCSDCGARLAEGRQRNVKRDKVHVDVAHPINTECREMLQERVLAAYEEEAASAGEEPEAGVEQPEAGVEQPEAGVEEDYYGDQEPTDEYYEEEAEAEEEVAIVMEALAVVEEVEAALDEEEEVVFPLEPARDDILEKEEDLGNLIESSLAEDEAFGESLDEIEEVEETTPFEPPAVFEPAAEEEEEEEETQEPEPSPERPMRRRRPREESGGGFGEGIL